MIRPCALAALALVATSLPADAAPPQRIVSLNLCTDQILIDLVPASRIRALSHVATDASVSSIAERARSLTRVRGEAEEVLALDPDLVVTTELSTPTTASMLERLGRRVLKVPLASDIAGVREVVRRMAGAVGEAAAGEAVIAKFDQRLAALATSAPTGPAPTAVIYQVNSIASAVGTLEDEALRRAGLRNLATELHLDPGGRVALEAIIANPPDLLVLSGPIDAYRTVVADSLTHPALKAVMRERATLVVPWRHWLCATPYIADAIEALAEARRRLTPRRPPA
ncbi:MAG: ABC transporter substrate-binding protein [Hyphomicrobiaceae bacterium]